jgi:hypothetical protein
MSTAAQEEFNDLVAKNTHRETLHPEDRDDPDFKDIQDLSEEDLFRNAQIDNAMRMPTVDRLTGAGASDIKLPPVSFDSGRATGVKGVIADARNYEAARKNKWRHRVRTARNSIFGIESTPAPAKSDTDSSEDDAKSDADEEAFLAEWRESRRRELESEANRSVRNNRRTSPSVRIYGRLDEVMPWDTSTPLRRLEGKQLSLSLCMTTSVRSRPLLSKHSCLLSRPTPRFTLSRSTMRRSNLTTLLYPQSWGTETRVIFSPI